MDIALIFTGGDPPPPSVADELPKPDLVIAADSGFDTAHSLGFRVDVLIGDMDSIAATEIPRHVLVHEYPPDKDATDLELALGLVLLDLPGRVVVVGGSGGRFDHELAIAHLLCAERLSPIEELDWISKRASAHVVRSRRMIHGDIGTTLSLLPVGGDAVRVTTRGLQWELNGSTLHNGDSRGVSNVMTSPVADISVAHGCLLAVIPRI